MKKVTFHDKEQISLSDIQAIMQLVQDNGLAQLVQHLILGANKTIDGGEVAVSSPTAMTVEVAGSVGYHTGIPIIGDSTTVAIQPADASNPRIDIVAIGYAGIGSDSITRTFWNPETESEYNQSVNTRELDGFEVIVVEGTPGSSPSVPTDYEGSPMTDNYLILAEVEVGASVTTITGNDTIDKREIFTTSAGYLK